MRQAQQVVEDHRHQPARRGAGGVPHGHHAEMIFGKEADHGAVTGHGAGVIDEGFTRVLVDAPAQRVVRSGQAGPTPRRGAQFAGGGNARSVQHLEQRIRKHVRASTHLRDQPFLHVAQAGIDAGRRRHLVVDFVRLERHPAMA